MVRTDESTHPTHPAGGDGRDANAGKRATPPWNRTVPDHGASVSPRMFESDLVDAFSRIPYWVVPLIYVPVITLAAAGAVAVEGLSLGGLALTFALGWVVWSLLEYWLHRTLFHWVPDASWGEQFHFVLHGVHHTWYRDRLRLVMPPAASLATGVAVYGLLRGISALLSPTLDDAWVLGVFAGIVFGYLVYDMVHYYVHHGKPRSKMMRALRAHHSKHHHNPRFQDKKFGVSTTIWDHVFGTYE